MSIARFPPSATTTPLSTSVIPPLEVINHQNQNGVIAIIAGFSFGLVLLSASIKVFARQYFRNFRHDDITFAIAIVFAIIQGSIVFYQIHEGLGVQFPHVSGERKRKIRKAGLAADLFYIVVLFLSKTCCALFFFWLAPDARHRRLAWLLLGASAIWAVSSLLVEAFRCPLANEWPVNWQECSAFVSRWIYIGVFDMAIELAVVLVSFYFIWNRNIPLPSRLAIIGAFACRLPNIVLTILRIVFLDRALTSENSAYWKSRVACTTQITIGWTMFSCVIPYLRPLIAAYERNGLSSRRPSSKAMESISQGSSAAPERWQHQASIQYPDATGFVRFDLCNPRFNEAQEEDRITSMLIGSDGHEMGIRKTVKIELKDFEANDLPLEPSAKAYTASGAVI